MQDLFALLNKTQLRALKARSWVFVWVAFLALALGVALLWIQKFAGVSIDFTGAFTVPLILVAVLPTLLHGLIDPIDEAIRYFSCPSVSCIRLRLLRSCPITSTDLQVTTPPPRFYLA